MSYNGFSGGKEYFNFLEQHGEDTDNMINLLYIAYQISELYDEDNPDDFDELCEDILEIYFDDDFEDYNVVNIADAVLFIIKDSNYTVQSYIKRYRKSKDIMLEELLAQLESEEPMDDEDEEESQD
jgi:hypothetical protein